MRRAPEPAVLARKRRVAQAVLWFEQLWPAMWPALGVLGAYACFALVDAPAWLHPWLRIGLLAVTLAGAALLLRRGLRRMVRPTAALADLRLERASGLRHRPLATLGDQPAVATPEQEVLWREHVTRLRTQIGRLRVGAPRPGLAKRDGWALRGALLVALVAALGIAGRDAPVRLARAFVPSLPSAPAGPGVEVQAWVTPPAYTGLPPMVLRPEASETPAARVPEGSHVTVSVTGGRGVPDLAFGEASEPFRALDAASWQAERDLAGDGGRRVLAVRRQGVTVAAWTLTLIPDQPPTPAFTGPPAPNVAAGRPTLQSRLAWQATDDYGVASVQVELRLRERADAPPLVVPASFAGNPKSAHGIVVTDLTAHPWAGLPVTARLVAKDAPGHVGASEAEEFTLPERPFQHPVARALIAIRRQLSLTPDERRPARMVLDALADLPDAFDNATGILLNLRALSALLQRGRGQEAVDEAQSRMWDLALALEENAPERTAQALEQARQAMRDAVDPNRPDAPDKAEIDRRMQELRDAIQKHLQALAEQARREGNETPFDPQIPHTDARELDRLAEQLQNSLKEGRTEDAERQMAELEKLLEQLQNARPESGEQRERQRAQQRQRGREQMDAVQDMVQREGKLLDRSESRAAPRPNAQRPDASQPGQPQPGQPQPGQPQPGQPQPGQRAGDAKSQQAMRRALGELMQRFGDLTGQVPPPLGEADQAMREGAQALADGRDQAASDAARRAIEALQKGGQQMGQQIARQFGTGKQEGEGDEGEGQDGQNGQAFGGTDNRDGMTSGQRPGDQSQGQRRTSRRDPLGRPLHQGTSGSEEAGDVRVPDEMEQARTRQIQEELRRRGAERTRPQPELDYIDRLLKPF